MATVDDLKEQWENEDAAGQEKGVDTSPAAQTPADHTETVSESSEPESDDTVSRRETSSITEQFTGLVSGTAHVARTILPNRLPFYLGVGALIVIEVLEPPVLAAVALGYEAVKAWRPEDDERAARR